MKRFKLWLAGKMLPFVVRHEPAKMLAKINERALEVAVPMVMAAMERAGLVHCHLCPNKRGPLRKIGGRMACPRHIKEIERLACETKVAV